MAELSSTSLACICTASAAAGAALAIAWQWQRSSPSPSPSLYPSFSSGTSTDAAITTSTATAATTGSACIRDGHPGLVGNTPLIRIPSLSAATGCTVLGKCEFLNPGGSSKDRVALRMVEEAEAEGRLGPGGTIVEGSAGSTGVSLSLMARARGYGCSIFIPDDAAKEKSDLLEQFGARVERVPPASIVNQGHYCNRAEREAAGTRNAIYANQFENLANFRAHYETTGPEIWRQAGGRINAFVMAAGTGGTVAGVARFLKEQDPSIRVFLVDPPGSSLYNKVKHGVVYAPQQAERKLRRNRYDTITEGIGIDRLTANFKEGLAEHNGGKAASIDDAFQGTDQEAVDMAHFLLQHDGLFVGSSSAMNCVGTVRAARQLHEAWDAEGGGRERGEAPPVLVTILCDSGARHLTKMYNREYLAARGLRDPAADDDAGRALRAKPPGLQFVV